MMGNPTQDFMQLVESAGKLAEQLDAFMTRYGPANSPGGGTWKSWSFSQFLEVLAASAKLLGDETASAQDERQQAAVDPFEDFLFTILADCSRCGEPLNETELSYLDGLPICESCRMIAEAAGGSAPAGQ